MLEWIRMHAVLIVLCAAAAVAVIAAAAWYAKRGRHDRGAAELTQLMAEKPQSFSGLYTGMYRTSRGEWKAWQNWSRTFRRRALQACPELEGCRAFAAEPQSGEEAAQLAQLALRCAQDAGIRLCTAEEYPQENEWFMLDTGEDLEPGTPCRTLVPAFVFGGEALECGMVSRIED
ncbi:MAG: hypothetical protein J6K32_07290 [Clostridia bacterium]|nr:hypothetical protein [Clostridia bacterium]